MTPAVAVIAGYAAIVLLGGIMGYATAGSLHSLTASLASAVVLAVAAAALMKGKSWGLPLALVVIVVLLGFFGMRFYDSGKMMPGGLMVMLSLLALVGVALTARRA